VKECSSARSAAGDDRVSEWADGVGWGVIWSQSPLITPLFSADKLWFCCLSPNHKVLQYGDVEEGAKPPTLESLPEQRKEGRVGAPTPAPSPYRPHTSGQPWAVVISRSLFYSPCGRHQGTPNGQGLPPCPGEGLWEAEQGDCSRVRGPAPLSPSRLFPA
jgi:hypothetical protein